MPRPKKMSRPRKRTTYDHDAIANRLAKKLKTKHRREGVDIVSQGRAIEVAVNKNDLYQSIAQLNRSRAANKYIALPALLIPDARRLLEDSGIGIMTTSGKIIKRSRRRLR